MRLSLPLLLVLVAIPGAGSFADDSWSRFESGEQMSVDADSIEYDKLSDTVTARGSVLVRRGETELTADQVILRRSRNEAQAFGKVSLSDPEGVLFADEVLLNLDDETAAMAGASLRSRRLQYSLWGSRLEKGQGQSYRIADGRFTTCNCEQGRQSWSIGSKSMEVTREGYGILKGATFNVLDVPILYLPRAVIPVQRERQSGFLMPRFGASNQRGFQILLPFYWSISKSQDASLAFDVETSARLGTLAEYRYALSRQSRGTLSATYFNESIRGRATSGSSTIPTNRWSVAVDQRQSLPGGGRVFVDALLVSDDQFLREINTYAFDHRRTVAIRTLPYTAARAGAVQLWDRGAAKLEGNYFLNLADELESRTLQVAPRATAWGQGKVASPVLADISAEATNFQRGYGTSGGRVDVAPGLSFPVPLERFGFGSVRVGGRGTGYFLDETHPGAGSTELPSTSTRGMVDVRGEVGTIFDRVYDVQRFGLQKIKHTIEPQAGYFYVPAVAQADLPLWDGVDRINQRNLVTYGVVSRFMGKSKALPGAPDSGEATRPVVRELARLSLMQSYDVGREILPVQQRGGADHFSDIDLAGRLNPNRFLSFRFLVNYDTSIGDISGARVGFFIEDPRAPEEGEAARRLGTRTSAGVSYRFLAGDQLQQVDTNMVLRLTRWAGLLYSSRYNILANRFLDNFFGLRLVSSCDCWTVDLAVTNRSNPNETEVRAQVTLLGLSSPRQYSRVARMP